MKGKNNRSGMNEAFAHFFENFVYVNVIRIIYFAENRMASLKKLRREIEELGDYDRHDILRQSSK